MEVQIIDIQENRVLVNTAIGRFSATWCSSTPEISKKYIVELDSDEVLTLDAVTLSCSRNPCIECTKKETYFTGFVEEIQDGVMCFRLYKSIMMLEISTKFDFSKFIGHYVRIRLSEIKLYNTEIF